jgi:hypothetical protein
MQTSAVHNLTYFQGVTAMGGNGGKGKSWLELFLVPIVIALVGTAGTFIITKYQSENAEMLAREQMANAERVAMAQLESSRRSSKTEQEMKILEVFGDKLISENPLERQMALDYMLVLGGDMAERLAGVAAEIGGKAEYPIYSTTPEFLNLIKVEVEAHPERVSPGEKVELLITVRTGDNQVLPEAAVHVESGGGKFFKNENSPYNPKARLHGPYSIAGHTDNNGQFRTWWVCNPCAGAYVLNIESAKKGYITGSAEFTIPIE